jgi:hypothetical protein
MTDEQKAVQMIYLSVKSRLGCNFEQFAEALKDWKFIPLIENNEVIGGVMQKANELHIGYGKKAKSSILRHIRQPLRDAINDYGFAETFVMEDNAVGIEFCKRLNFVEISRNNGKILLRCHRSKYA